MLARERGLAVLNLPGHRRGDGSWLPRGVDERVDDVTALRRWVPDIAERDVYVCGPERVDRPGPRHPHSPPVSPTTGSTSRRSAGDPT